MNSLLRWLTSPEWSLVVKALLHSLWQGAVIVAVLALLLRSVHSATLRYRLALAGLGLVFASLMITWAVLNTPRSIAGVATPVLPAVADAPVASGPVQKFVVVAERKSAKTEMPWTAWLALAWLIGASAMLGRASVKIAGAEQLRRSCRPLDNERVSTLVAEARRAVKLTRRIRVAVTDQLTSPAVVGILVPTLILPLSLITTLTPEQIRYVLLHELAHIRRGDYLANLFQLFAEALLFFNPAVWWLSHQVRREREACCDALAIELSGAPTDYARTLVSVAETMLNPSPTVAPAFGNERETSSLADRVQRLLVPGYRPSLRLTWRAMLGALASSVVVLWILAIGTKETVAATTTLLAQTDRPPTAAPNGSPVGLQNDALLLPTSSSNSIRDADISATVPGRNQISNLLENIRLSQLALDELPLGEVTRALRDETVKHGSGKGGINFIIINSAPPAGAQIDPATGLPLASNAPPRVDLSALPITIQPALHDVKLRDALEAIIKASPQPITYAIEDYAIVIKVADANVMPLFTRSFKVDTNDFLDAVRIVRPASSANLQSAVRGFLSSKGVDLKTPGKSVFYNDRQGALFARGTLADLGAVERTLQEINERKISRTATAPISHLPVMAVDPATGFPATSASGPSVINPATGLPAGNATNLFTRTFSLGSNALAQAVEKYLPPGVTLGSTNNLAALHNGLRQMFAGIGVELESPGKSFWIKDRQGILLVRATLRDLDAIESLMQTLRAPESVTSGSHRGIEGKTSVVSISSESATFNSSEKALTARGHVEITAANGMKFTAEKARIQMGTNSGAIIANTNLFTRTFKVSTNEFIPGLETIESKPVTNLQAAVRSFLSSIGVDFRAPGKSVFYNDGQGVLIVRASLADLDIVEQALQVVNTPVPQVNIRAKFVEVSAGFMTNDLIKFICATNKAGALSGVLTDPQTRMLFRIFEQMEGVDILAAPDVTTLSGRQAQIQVVDMKTVITGETPIITNGFEARLLQTTNLPFGPVLDVVATVTADGFSIQMLVIPTVTEFLGYDDPGPGAAAKVPLPHYRVRQIPTSAPAIILDGQTLVMGGFVSENVWHQPGGIVSRQAAPGLDKKHLLVFVTPTIIDRAGNRVHQDEDVPSKGTNAPSIFPRKR